jgi:hypothetical protein
MEFPRHPESGKSGQGLQILQNLPVARALKREYPASMKTVELSDETHAALLRLASAHHLTPAELIASLLDAERAGLAGDSLLSYLTGPEFNRESGPDERYLDLLGWCARNHAADFADFVSHQESGRRYLAWHRAEINEARARNQARQIGGTQYWAVMTLDLAGRRRFLCRLLEFIGCHDETVARAGESIDPPASVGSLRRHGT